MEKQLIEKRVFHTIDSNKPIPFSVIKDIVEDDDKIVSGWNEGFYSENNSMDPHFEMSVYRMVMETDEEFQKRKERAEWDAENRKKHRYENYLRLKKEFEPNNEN
jgi:hypothetical protein